jgi:hypothetical protein
MTTIPPDAAAQTEPDSTLPAPWLAVVRVAWPLAALASLAVLLLSLPGYLQDPLGGTPVDVSPQVLSAYAAISVVASMAAAALSLALAGLLYWRRPNDRMAVFISFVLLGYGIIMAGPLEQLRQAWPALAGLNAAAFQQLFFATPFIALFGLFPDGRFVPRWMRWVTLASLAMAPASFIAPCCSLAGGIRPELLWASTLYWLVLVILGVYAQVYRYRRVSSLAERQQTRWVVYGQLLMIGWFIISTIPYMITVNLPPGSPQPWWSALMGALWWLSLIIFPATLTIAVLRFRLFDLEVIVRRTLVYSVLTALLALVYTGSVILLQRVFSLVGGDQSTIVIVLSTLVIAALFSPLRQRVKAGIDRRFYRRDYDSQQVLAAFGQTTRDEVELQSISAALLSVVDETLQPEHAWLWHRGDPVRPTPSGDNQARPDAAGGAARPSAATPALNRDT